MESEEQHIRIKAILEIVGKPKEFIEKKCNEYIANIGEDANLILIDSKVSDAVPEGEMFSLFAEIEIVIKGIENLAGFCIDYMPSSIEVIKPDKFDFEQRVFTNILNDILAKLHNVDMIAKRLSTENKFMKKNMNNLIKNNIAVLISMKINKADKISKATGIDEKEVKKYLDALVEDNKIKEDDGVYSIA